MFRVNVGSCHRMLGRMFKQHVSISFATLAFFVAMYILYDLITDRSKQDHIDYLRTKKPQLTNATTWCEKLPPGLGPTFVKLRYVEIFSEWDLQIPHVLPGGRYKPLHCIPRHKVAIIVPYSTRDLKTREYYLKMFLYHMHYLLKEQQIEYGIFIMEQKGKRSRFLNSAKLFNVGFLESQKLTHLGWQCFVFHDADLYPLDSRSLYTCPRQPRHMAVKIDDMKNSNDTFGVYAMTVDQFLTVNGYSNKYWGWRLGYDSDMLHRLKRKNYRIESYNVSIGRYTRISRRNMLTNFIKRHKRRSNLETDGLSTLKYTIENITKTPLYTHIEVNIDEISASASIGVTITNSTYSSIAPDSLIIEKLIEN